MALNVEQMEDRIVPTLLGQQLFPADNPWNQNISNAPVAANSAAIISHIGASIHLHPDWGADNPANGSSPLYGVPVNIVHGNSTTKVHVVIDNYPGESDLLPVPIPANAVVEGDYQNGPNTNGGGYNSGQRGDSHMIVWDEDTNTAYELYGVTRPTDPMLFPNTSGVELPHTDNQWHAAGEAVWNMNADSFRTLGATSADAAGLSILAGLARPDEGLTVAQGGQGAINHALRFTLPGGDVAPQYIYPASHMVNMSAGADKLPLGSRLRLANTPAVNAIISNMPPESQVLARAMQQYGLILADIGSAMYITGSSATVDNVDSPKTNLTWDLNDIFASNGLKALTAADFEVVNLAPVVTGLSAASGSAGSTITITGQNFSGAASHLSVLFGSTASPSVTCVDDSHISAVVPTGSGTVDVTVRSGVIENDTISTPANANVNAPLFGYGTSATSSADRFTFGAAPTISAVNSTANFATATVASGLGDVLTVVVKDGSGNPVSGLTGSAFGFTLAGGGSTGTFGTVTATATAGTYTATFTGTTAGTASTLTVTVGGVTLAATPTVEVTGSGVSAATSTVKFLYSTLTSGHAEQVTLVLRDGAGNPVSGLTTGAFGFSLSGGTSAGTFGPVRESTTKGTYLVAFTGTTAGSASTLTATVGGAVLTSASAVTVTPGAVSAATSTVSWSAPTLTSGATDTLTIAVKDAAGNPIGGLLSSAFYLTLSGGSRGTFGPVTETTTKGTYTATFTGTTAGTASTLTARVRGVTLLSKPTLQVTPGEVSGTRSTVRFAYSAIGQGHTDMVTLVLKDGAGNVLGGLSATDFSFVLSGGTSSGSFGTVTETATKGTYKVSFTSVAAGTPSTLTAAVKGHTLLTHPTVLVTFI